MPDIATTINPGQTATFQAALLDNGSAITAPNPFTWTVSDPSLTVTPSSDTTSATVAVPADTTLTSFEVTATTVDPNGASQSGSDSQTIVQPQKFTVTVTRTA